MQNCGLGQVRTKEGRLQRSSQSSDERQLSGVSRGRAVRGWVCPAGQRALTSADVRSKLCSRGQRRVMDSGGGEWVWP